MNRPGKTGFRVRKKKTDAAEVRIQIAIHNNKKRS